MSKLRMKSMMVSINKFKKSFIVVMIAEYRQDLIKSNQQQIFDDP